MDRSPFPARTGAGRPNAGYGPEIPAAWWGHGSAKEGRPSLAGLVRSGVLSPGIATLLTEIVARHRSLVVIAAGAGVGKTTLLTSLLPALDTGTRRIFLRGTHESFDFRLDPTVVPRETALMVNEISPHLPAYLWGPAVGRSLRLGLEGYAILATAHAGSVESFLATLAGPPLALRGREIAVLETVALLAPDDEPSPTGRGLHRVVGVWGMMWTRTGAGLQIMPLSRPARTGSAAKLDVAAIVRWGDRGGGPGADLADAMVAATTRERATGDTSPTAGGTETVE
ncbi:MAG: hypothetical protein WKF80_12275 [Thermomicrobiales bacterium]